MVSKSSDSASKLKRGGEQSGDGIGKSLYQKMYQLKAQIQADRAISVKERVERNKKKLEADVSHLLSSSRKNDSLTGRSGAGELVSFRAGSPVIQYSGFPQGSGERDHLNGHEVAPPMSIKLPFVEKIPPYTTWIFLDRNQRMTEDQSVVGRRRIYYDQHGSEALICSDSEEELVEHEEEKHEFSEGEDRFVWTVFQEYGLAEEVLNSVSQFIGVPTSEVQERCDVLKEKYSKEQNAKDCADPGFESGICLDKSLSAALDSFDNLFCRRCMVFDCCLHGCSQTLINPSEKQSYWSEYEDDRKPCGDQCCLHLRVVKDKSVHPVDCALEGKTTATLEERDATMAQGKEEQSGVEGIAGPMESEILISDKEMPVTSESVCDPELAVGFLNFDRPTLGIHDEHNKKRKSPQDIGLSLDDKMQDPDDMNDSSCKKLKKLTLDVVAEAVDNLSSLDHSSSFKSEADNNDLYMNAKNTDNCSNEHALKELTCGKENMGEKAKDVTEEHEPNQPSLLEKQQGRISSLSEWRPIEKELYLKGVEIFGKNSCLIARNLLSGLKTCVEVYNYMCNSGATLSHRSVASSSFLQESGKADTDYVEQEMPTRSRLLRRRGRTRKLKYSWKSAGHPSMWKRIADGKNQYYKQYTPCGCQSMCGKQCPCLNNGTCCEKYCGCSKSCKNRFRGCHCAKSQCRSRQCPCFAAGRECDPDVCRNCWVSCGDGSLGEPPKQGDGQCGNMRLLLRQQQRILLAKSDVAGWGAFLKNSVNKNDYLGEYTGELISHREADKRGKIYDRANSSFLFDLNDQYVLDAYRKGDKLKFANHSSNPNCYAKVMLVAGDHRVGIFAKEHIEASEELFYDYRYGPDQAPAWARKPEGSKRDDSAVSQGRAKKHHSHS